MHEAKLRIMAKEAKIVEKRFTSTFSHKQQVTDFAREGSMPIDGYDVTVVPLDTGEILSTHTIDPERGYWRN